VLIIAVGVAAAFALRGGDEVTNVPTPPFDTPQEAVEAWVAAQNAGDGETYLLLFAPDASDGALNQGGIASEQTVKDRVELIAATETVFSMVECAEEGASQATCIMTRHSPMQRIESGTTGLETSVALTIDESGAIARVGVNPIGGGTFDETRFEAYKAFMEENYPELRAELMQNWVTDPIDRPAADIGRENLAAAREFDAQYDG
jgi:coenzyme F420-reducing hydrogenase gamma subunit